MGPGSVAAASPARMHAMRRTGIAELPLHHGRAPRWLFERMVRLSRAMVLGMREDVPPSTILVHLSDPYWFQAFGCVLGFDWHSSGLTTTVCGALKEALRGLEGDVGLFVTGGKGATSRRTPTEIVAAAHALGRDLTPLARASRMAAKVDSAALQDGFELYHHTFVFTATGEWAVVQQGMSVATRYARRYHWLGERITTFVSEPHAAIVSDRRESAVLNLVAAESDAHRAAIVHAVHEESPEALVTMLRRLRLPARHPVVLDTDVAGPRVARILLETYERRPANFEELLGLPGVGAKTLRALSLAAEVMYGLPGSLRDPAAYSFAHGGKDGHPYPVDRQTYDGTIAFLEATVRHARLGDRDRLAAFRRLASLEL